MDERTRAYLRGRFRDFYRKRPPAEPPAADRREWGYIPWTDSPGTTMVRHQSLLELGDLGDFLARERPQHVYYSAGRYRDPGAPSMGEKGWEGADLIFDIDADHLPDVDPAETSYGEMLEAGKGALQKLLDFLQRDFGFQEISVYFSGGRGYHAHVRDEMVLKLGREERSEIAAHVLGSHASLDPILRDVPVPATGYGRSTGTTKSEWKNEGGWGRRMHENWVEFIDEIHREIDKSGAMEKVQKFENVGTKTARKFLDSVQSNYQEVREGNVELSGVRRVAEPFLDSVIRQNRVLAPIDDPVTTDTHRLIRLPGSLHGGTALKVTPVPLDGADDFDPLVDAVPEPFVGHDVAVRGDGGPPVELGGETFTVPDGKGRLPEFAANFLMARGRAAKEKE